MSASDNPEGGFHAGTLAIVGEPNVGKSTLINRLVGQKVTITSRKPQTTRHRISGILTTDTCQYVFVDTPGFQTRHGGVLNRLMNRTVTQALASVDVVIVVLDALRPRQQAAIIDLLPRDRPVLAALNKIDRLADKAKLLPLIRELSDRFPFTEIVPLSALTGKGIDDLLAAAARYLPEAPPVFDPEDISDRPERFHAAELLREQLFRNLGEELPYGIAVEIERFESEGDLRRIYAAILVDKPAHKAMVIGRGGAKLKSMASEARRQMEQLFGGTVYLETWVKVKSGWAEDQRVLKSLGYE